MTPCTRDRRRLLVAAGVRNFAYGFLSVVLGLHLAGLGMDDGAVGGIFTLALTGGAGMTVAVAAVADRAGRRRMMLLGAVLMAASGAVFALGAPPLILAVAAVAGTVSPSGKEVGPFLSLEQAILPQTVGDARRTSLIALYNVVSSLAGAGGALAAGLPALLGAEAAAGYRALLWAYAGCGLVLLALYAGLSPAVEPPPRVPGVGPRTTLGVHRSRGLVARLAALFALDAFGGGLIVQGLLALWFHRRFGVDETTLGALFFGTNLLSALSFLAAPALARRFGLLNTMVFTHLPSNLILILVPFMPTFETAALVLLARHPLSQLDVPARQSWLMAIVEPDERTAAAGLTSAVRNVAGSLGPAVAGRFLAGPLLWLVFPISGGIKIVYDVTLWFAFRRVRPPEER